MMQNKTAFNQKYSKFEKKKRDKITLIFLKQYKKK